MSVLVFCLVVASSIALIVMGIQLAQAAGAHVGRDARSTRATGLMLGAAGFLTLAGCLVPFNTGGTDLPSRAVVPDEGAFSFDAVVGGLALLGLALCCPLDQVPRRPRGTVERRGRVGARRPARVDGCCARARGRVSARPRRERTGSSVERTGVVGSRTPIRLRLGAESSHISA